jgi:hypothetical protein
VDAIQQPFDLAHRDVAVDVLLWTRGHEAGVIVYSPMTRACSRARSAPSARLTWRRVAGRPGIPTLPGRALSANLALTEALRPVAQQYGVASAAVAIAWTRAFPGVTRRSWGRRPGQIDGWLPTATLEVTEDGLAEIAAAVHATGAETGPAVPASLAAPRRQGNINWAQQEAQLTIFCTRVAPIPSATKRVAGMRSRRRCRGEAGLMATQQSTPEAPVAAAHASAEPGGVTGRGVAGRSWRPVLAWPLRTRDGIWLESAGPVPEDARGERVVGLPLAGAVTAFAAAQYAIGHPVAPEAWLAIAPLLASLALRPLRTALLAGWTVLLGLGLALDVSGPPGRLTSNLAVLALLAGFAVANSALRIAAQRRLGQARAVARVAQSALLREVPRCVAAARLASRYLSALAEAQVGGDIVEVIADGANPRWLVGDTRVKESA